MAPCMVVMAVTLQGMMNMRLNIERHMVIPCHRGRFFCSERSLRGSWPLAAGLGNNVDRSSCSLPPSIEPLVGILYKYRLKWMKPHLTSCVLVGKRKGSHDVERRYFVRLTEQNGRK